MPLNDLFEIGSQVRLSPDMNSWGEQILAQLLKSHSSLAKLVGEVVFSKVDAIKGNAVGYITLIGKTQRVPFIVDEYELNPLDLYVDNGRYLPLTERTLERLSSRNWTFRLISQEERRGILKTASFFEGEEKKKFIDRNEDLLQKIASEHPDVIEFFANRESEEKSEDYVVRCFVKTASDEKPIVVRDLVGKDVDYKISDFAQKFGVDFVKQLMSDGEVIVSNMPHKLRLAIDKLEAKCAYKQTQNRAGVYFHNSEGLSAYRYDHHRMSDLKRSESSPSVFITQCGKYFASGDMLEPHYHHTQLNTTHQSTPPAIGDYAVVVIGDNVYGPIFITSVSVMGGEKIYGFNDDSLRNCKMRTSPDIKSIVKLDDGAYLVSHYVKVMKVHICDPSKNPAEILVKTAEMNVMVSKQTNGKLVVNDSGLSGINSSKLNNLGRGDATVVLMRAGLSESDAKYAIMKAFEGGAYSFPAPAPKKEKAPEVDKELQKKAEEIANLAENSHILKTASISGDRSNIDMALGLNLITPNNIKRFKLIVPEIYSMLDKLCKLLVVKRMNRGLFPDINESEMVTSIRALDAIAHSLNSL